ncbi:flavodoxin family protein [Clostridium ganghwense]|uniref:Flavodoxin family protein n=1 Tax=Clostridium ganghwense TaxID=312089 RepID=A0ABT4CRI2_9CLOT|nr:flavodoxin family protein [Clostridium ganghwense]MCY6371672.1 flavodoxin family protein [Clostridium ganghwense]
MKVSIVFHSVCGNTYLMAKQIYKNFSDKEVDVCIYRVKDDDLKEIAKNIPVANEHLSEILKVPIINLDKILESDYIFLGSPTYFGNVSAEMKSFMDSFSPLWADAKLFGKRVISFTTCGTAEAGGENCLKAINTFAQHLGMINIPIPSNLVPDKSNSAYGLLHCSGNMGDNRLGPDCKKSISNLVDLLIDKKF